MLTTYSAVPQAPAYQWEETPNVIQEFFITLLEDTESVLSQPQQLPDQLTYLKRAESENAQAFWIYIPFYPEQYGMRDPQEHPVFGFIRSQLVKISVRQDYPEIHLIPSEKELIHLRNVLKIVLEKTNKLKTNNLCEKCEKKQ